MKVTTDACLFGALMAKYLPDLGGSASALDIGTGTGLLSLMIAQRQTQLRIKALEIDEQAAGQAGENFSSSPWKENLEVIQTDLLDFGSTAPFDLIFSNPPFYENELSSPDTRINLARHNNDLPLSWLVFRISELLTDKGEAWLLLPYKRSTEFRQLVSMNSLAAERIIIARNSEKHEPFRIIVQIRKNKAILEGPVSEELFIYNADGNYTAAFEELLSPYYLRL